MIAHENSAKRLVSLGLTTREKLFTLLIHRVPQRVPKDSVQCSARAAIVDVAQPMGIVVENPWTARRDSIRYP